MIKKKVYLSGCISELPDDEANFKRAEELLLGMNYAVYNPVEAKVIQEMYKEFGFKARLAKCMAMLRFCDCIYMLKNWENSLVAKAEKAFAEACGIQVLYEK